MKAFRTALIWVLIFILVGGSLYFLDNIIPSMSSLLVGTRDIVQSPPFILKFDKSSEKFINIFSELPLILPKYNNGFLIKYNNLADVYILSSSESLTNYIEDLSKINMNGSVKITKSWLNGFQVFSTKIGFTYYITQWRDYIIISNDPDYLKDLFDNIILAARSDEEALPESIFEPGNKNFGFVQPSGADIFATLYSIPFIQISYPITYFLSLNSIKINFKTNETVETETTSVNKLQVFNFYDPVFEIASNNPEKFNTLLKNNFIAYFLEKYNIAIDKILKADPGLSEFVLLKDETCGFILQTQNPDEVIDNIDTDVTSTNINDSGQLVNKLEINGKYLYLTKMHNYVLIFENGSVIKELLDNNVARNSYDGSLFMMYGEKFNSVVPDKYNVAKVISPYADFSAILASADNENQLLIIGGK